MENISSKKVNPTLSFIKNLLTTSLISFFNVFVGWIFSATVLFKLSYLLPAFLIFDLKLGDLSLYLMYLIMISLTALFLFFYSKLYRKERRVLVTSCFLIGIIIFLFIIPMGTFW